MQANQAPGFDICIIEIFTFYSFFNVNIQLYMNDISFSLLANPLLPAPMKTCKKPYRLGLSKRQKLSSLHPKLKRV